MNILLHDMIWFKALKRGYLTFELGIEVPHEMSRAVWIPQSFLKTTQDSLGINQVDEEAFNK